jgi:hypothetical protein
MVLSMSNFNKVMRSRRRRRFNHPGMVRPPGKPARTWWFIATISLLMVSVPIRVIASRSAASYANFKQIAAWLKGCLSP